MGWVDGFGPQLGAIAALPWWKLKLQKVRGWFKREQASEETVDTVEGHRFLGMRD